ncbi:MAG: hypothetical protein EA369_00055 [Bradymonadales bacterium]|nr:MAG: hypothetical protein EA369_00055 [Bradymonadales bacterium]
MAKRDKRSGGSTQNELVVCDLEFPNFQKSLAQLNSKEINQFFDVVENKIQKMTWRQIYATSSKSKKRGLNWEVIEGQKTAKGGVIASIRITQKSRARVTRDGKFMRFISVHPDHDSAYEKGGGEDL